LKTCVPSSFMKVSEQGLMLPIVKMMIFAHVPVSESRKYGYIHIYAWLIKFFVVIEITCPKVI